MSKPGIQGNYFTKQDWEGLLENLSTPIPFNSFVGTCDHVQETVGGMKTAEDVVRYLWAWVRCEHNLGGRNEDCGRAIFQVLEQWNRKHAPPADPHIDDSEDKAWAMVDRIYGKRPWGRDYSHFKPDLSLPRPW